jgi:hypothetical protein
MPQDIDLQSLEAALSAPPGLNVDFHLRFVDPRPLQLLEHWRARCRGSLLPRRADFDPVSLKAHLGWLCIVEVLPDRCDLVYRLIGSRIVEIVGRDATGKRVSEVLPPAALTMYRHVMEAPRPVRVFGAVEWRDKGYISHETLALPLADDGRTVDRFLLEMAFGPAPKVWPDALPDMGPGC